MTTNPDTHEEQEQSPTPLQDKRARSERPSLMRSIGQSVGILWKAIREPANPNESATHTEQVSKEVREERQGNVTLRETTIREIEYHDSDDDHSSPSSSTDDQPTRSIESNPEAEQDRK